MIDMNLSMWVILINVNVPNFQLQFRSSDQTQNRKSVRGGVYIKTQRHGQFKKQKYAEAHIRKRLSIYWA